MKLSTFRGARSVYALMVAGLVMAAAVPIFMGRANAADLTGRNIKMADATPGTDNVTYQVGFTPSVGVAGLVIDFCSDSPINIDTCTAPTDMDVSGAALTDWTRVAGAAPASTLILTKDSGTISGAQTLSITGIDNPSTLGSFYARVYTFVAPATASAYVTATPGAYTDFGGVALSTVAQISITSKVMERLVFCVYTGANCAAGGSSILLGDARGVLDDTKAYTNNNINFDIKTNAQGGVTVRAITYGSTEDTILTSGTNHINAIGATAAVSTAGTEQFGLCVDPGAGVAAISPYDDASCGDQATGEYTGAATFALPYAVTGATYGDEIASVAGPTDTVSGKLAFIGNIAVTTPAGIYTSQMGLIATGTF